jgi:hypothetical protein
MKRKELPNFQKDIDINENKLSEELIQQPQKFYRWGVLYAEAQADTARCKDQLDMMKNKVELEIRKTPKKYDEKGKLTEGQIKALVNTDSRVEELNNQYLELLKVEKILAKAERAFEHRKKSLEGLVSLNMQYYFSTPKTNQQAEEERLVKTANERKLRRRKRT